MIQLVYISSAHPAGAVDVAPILQVSRRNNGRDGLSGLLYADGRRFLQVLEGEATKVEAAFARISADPRHRAIVVLSRREIEAREFGEWAMAHRAPVDDADSFIAQVDALASNAAPDVRATFSSLARHRRAA